MLKNLYAKEGPCDRASDISVSHLALDSALAAAHGLAAATEIEIARVKSEFEELETGEDAIKFFTKYRTEGGPATAANIWMVHCNRPSKQDMPITSRDLAKSRVELIIGPYDLVVVPKERVHAEYFTISANGVVHFQPGQSSECTPLAEWMRQSLMFRVLRSMSFFRLFGHQKGFAQWKCAARYESFVRRRSLFVRKCYLAKPIFVSSIMEARRLALVDDGTIDVLDLSETTKTCQEFVHRQSSASSHPMTGAAKKLESRLDQLAMVLEKLLGDVVAVGENTNDPLGKSFAQPAARTKAMAVERRESADKIRRMHLARDDESKVPSCIRMLSFILQSSLVALMKRASADMKGRVASAVESKDPAKCFLTVNAKLAKRESYDSGPAHPSGFCIVLEPNSLQLQEVVSKVWEDLITCVDSLPTLSTLSPRLKTILGATALTGTVAEVLANDEDWKDSVGFVRSTLMTEMEQTLTLARAELLDPCSRVIAFDNAWDETGFLTQHHTLASLTEDVGNIRKMYHSLTRCRGHRCIGSLQFDARGLLNELAHIPDNALAVMRQVLCQHANEQCSAVCRQMESAIRSLAEDRPGPDATAQSIAAYSQSYQDVVREHVAVEKVIFDVKQAYDLLWILGARISLEDRVQIEAMRTKESHLSDAAIFQAKLFLDRNTQTSSPVTVTVESGVEDYSLSVSLLTPAT